MDNPSPDANDDTGSPAPQTLVPESNSESTNHQVEATTEPISNGGKKRRGYRVSHRATFIGVVVVAAILAVNAVIIGIVIKSQEKQSSAGPQGQVTISQSVLDKLGVSRSAVSDSGIQLNVGPNAKFNGSVTIAGDTSIAGQLKLNSKFSASDASLSQLEAGNTSLGQLNVNGDGTVSNLNLRNNLLVTGTTHLQGAVTLSQLLTVDNSVNIASNETVGGTLSATQIAGRSVISTSTLTIGGHVITSGNAPTVAPGNALGSNGTVAISGNDAAGTVSVNIGVGASGGELAAVTFHSQYGNIPRVVVTPIGGPVGGFYINRNSAGFNIDDTSGLSPGGYAFDFIVEQ